MTEAIANPKLYFHAYTDSATPVPTLPPAMYPIPDELWQPFVDKVKLVTFTILVPLSVVAGGGSALDAYAADMFDNRVQLWDTAYRAVGEASSNEDFEGEFVGDVCLQVICTLQSL